jgi:hypothetical protein
VAAVWSGADGAAGSVLMRDAVLYILLTSSALLHLASLDTGTPNSGFALVTSLERLRLRVVPRSSAKPEGPF